MVIRDAYDKGLAGRSSGLHGGVNPPKPPMPPGFDRTQGPGGPNSLPAWATNPGVRDAAAAANPQGPGAPPPPGAGGMPAGRSFFDLIADMAGGGGMGGGIQDPRNSEAFNLLMGLARGGTGDMSALNSYLDAGRANASRMAGSQASTSLQRALASGAPASAGAGLANQAVGDVLGAYNQMATQAAFEATEAAKQRQLQAIGSALDIPLRADIARSGDALQAGQLRLGAANMGLNEANMGFDQALRAADFQRTLNQDMIGYGSVIQGQQQAGINAQQNEQQRQFGAFLDQLNALSGLQGSTPYPRGGGGSNTGIEAGQFMQSVGGLLGQIPWFQPGQRSPGP